MLIPLRWHRTNKLDANDNKYSTATSLNGPWSDWADFAPSGSKTYNSQTNFILGVGGTVMYVPE